MKLCETMIRDGTDQCRAALKRFGSKKQFRIHNSKGSLTKKDWKKHIENLDLKFDQLDKEIDSIVRKSRQLCEMVMNTDSNFVQKDSDEISDNFVFDTEGSDVDSFRSNVALSSKQVGFHPHASVVRGAKIKTRRVFSGRKHSKRRRGNTLNQTDISENRIDKSTTKRRSTGRRRRGRNKRETKMEIESGFPRRKRGSNQKRTLLDESQPSNTNQNGRHGSTENLIKEIGSDATDLESSTGVVTEERIFNDLLNRDGGKQLNVARICFDSSTINEICDKLSLTYPTDEGASNELLRQLPLLLTNPHVLDGNAHYVSILVFETLLRTFRAHGSISLQEMIHTNRNCVQLHVDLLVCTIKILGLGLHSHLEKSDGRIFNIFSVSGIESIVEFTILQLLDVLYAQLLPTAWGKSSIITFAEYTTFKALRDELGKVVHITEIASKLLCKSLKCQKWQRSVQKSWFVSSIACDYVSKYWSETESLKGVYFYFISTLLVRNVMSIFVYPLLSSRFEGTC